MGDGRMSWTDDVKWGPWIIPADGMSRFRYTADRREMDVQHREIVQCNGCRQRVLSWPGEHERHFPMIEHEPGCRCAQRAVR